MDVDEYRNGEASMRVLVTAASKHGATTEIATAIADKIRESDITVDLSPPDAVREVGAYDAVVVGSAVYGGHWIEPARGFVDRHAGQLRQRPVWLFSSGPIGNPPKPDQELVEIAPMIRRLGARGHRTFAGRLDPDSLGFVERALTAALRAPHGDFRDFNAIRSWAAEIAEALQPATVG
jgi:menaquinone-dependent protoporphyrinogen oxidase